MNAYCFVLSVSDETSIEVSDAVLLVRLDHTLHITLR